jgi:acetyl-CoA carboxylase biotin carboxyl carrier protein
MEINVDTIKELIGALGSAGIDRLNLETKEFKLSLERSQVVYAAPSAAPQVQISNGVQQLPGAEQPKAQPCGNVVTSPIVGTFYASASPEKPPFVRLGQQVKKGDTLFIVESMKLMNEITSDYDGTVAEIIAESGKGLEYCQPVMRIE